MYVDRSANGSRAILGLHAVDLVAEDPAATAEALAVAADAAVAAGAARGDAGGEHAVAGGERVDAAADVHDGADRFVAEDASGRDGGYVAAQDVQVGAADGDRVHLDDRVTGIDDGWVGNVRPRLVARAAVHHGLHVVLLTSWSVSSWAGVECQWSDL